MSPHKKQNPFGREHSRSMRRQKSERRQVAQNAARQQHAHGPPKQRPFPPAHRAVPRADIAHGVHRAPNDTGKQQSKQNGVCPQRARKIQPQQRQPHAGRAAQRAPEPKRRMDGARRAAPCKADPQRIPRAQQHRRQQPPGQPAHARTLLFFHPCTPPFSACSVPIIVSSARRCQGGAEKTKNHIDFYRRSVVKYHSRHKRRTDKRGWRNRQTRTFEGRVVIPCEFKSRSSHQKWKDRRLMSAVFLCIVVLIIYYLFDLLGTRFPFDLDLDKMASAQSCVNGSPMAAL